MNLLIFICPENQHISKYCEAFYNHIDFGVNRRTSTYGSGTWSTNSVSVHTKRAVGRLLPDRRTKDTQQLMKASDPALDRIYRKVISSECYDHTYYFLNESDVSRSDGVVYISSKSYNNYKLPSILRNSELPITNWKFSNIKTLTEQKYTLIETLIRKMINHN